MFNCFVGGIRLKEHGISGTTLLESGDDVEPM